MKYIYNIIAVFLFVASATLADERKTETLHFYSFNPAVFCSRIEVRNNGKKRSGRFPCKLQDNGSLDPDVETNIEVPLLRGDMSVVVYFHRKPAVFKVSGEWLKRWQDESRRIAKERGYRTYSGGHSPNINVLASQILVKPQLAASIYFDTPDIQFFADSLHMPPLRHDDYLGRVAWMKLAQHKGYQVSPYYLEVWGNPEYDKAKFVEKESPWVVIKKEVEGQPYAKDFLVSLLVRGKNGGETETWLFFHHTHDALIRVKEGDSISFMLVRSFDISGGMTDQIGRSGELPSEEVTEFHYEVNGRKEIRKLWAEEDFLQIYAIQTK